MNSSNTEIAATDAVTIDNPFGAKIAIFNPDTIAAIGTAIERLGACDTDIAIDDEASYEAATEAYKAARALSKQIDADRKSAQRPLRDAMSAWNKATTAHVDPLVDAYKAVERRIRDCDKLKRAEAKRIDDERRAAEREAEAKKRQAEREAEEARAAGDRKAAAEARERALVAERDAAQAELDRATTEKPKAKASAVKVVRRKVLVIDDIDEIPVAVSGRRLLVPDERAILDALKAGEFVPGCRIEVRESTGSSGR